MRCKICKKPIDPSGVHRIVVWSSYYLRRLWAVCKDCYEEWRAKNDLTLRFPDGRPYMNVFDYLEKHFLRGKVAWMRLKPSWQDCET